MGDGIVVREADIWGNIEGIEGASVVGAWVVVELRMSRISYWVLGEDMNFYIPLGIITETYWFLFRVNDMLMIKLARRTGITAAGTWPSDGKNMVDSFDTFGWKTSE